MALARRTLLAVPLVITAIAFAGSPSAGADPEDLLPWCSANQTPETAQCRLDPSQTVTLDAPGADPLVPLGPDPELNPATGSP